MTTDTKAVHTPGPWKAINHGGIPSTVKYTEFCIHNEGNGYGETVIATLSANDCWTIPVEANARLIAAAPDYFEAVEELLNSIDADNDDIGILALRHLRQAHAKAKGESL